MNQPIEDLAASLVTWMRNRRESVDWVYHPRKTDFSDFIRRKFLSDLLATCPAFHDEARRGAVVCDSNVSLSRKGGRTRKLDLVVGPPIAKVEVAKDSDVLRKSKLSMPRLALETKLCMTEHRKATSRLIDELLSSLDVVRAVSPNAICVSVVVVNVAKRFTSPLNLPGPNLHDRPQEIHRLIAKLFDRVPTGAGGYDALTVALLDLDNETRFEIGTGIEIPNERQYRNTVNAVGRMWAQQNFSKDENAAT